MNEFLLDHAPAHMLSQNHLEQSQVEGLEALPNAIDPLVTLLIYRTWKYYTNIVSTFHNHRGEIPEEAHISTASPPHVTLPGTWS